MNITIEKDNDRIKTYTPYHSDFVQRAKQLGGKWSGADKAWVFDARLEADVRDLLRETYGTDGTDTDLVTAIITARREVYARCGSVEAFGRVLARAHGRDSGAKVGDGVSVLTGKIRSGGSVKNWHTIIDEGTELKIFDVPRRLVDNIDEGTANDWSVEVVDAGSTEAVREALLAEKAQLEKRLAEIESELSE